MLVKEWSDGATEIAYFYRLFLLNSNEVDSCDFLSGRTRVKHGQFVHINGAGLQMFLSMINSGREEV